MLKSFLTVKNLLVLIILLAATLRLIGLTQYPVGFTPDEASFGYDAYSILLTGKDQWGNTIPLVLKSFGDYKAPIYAYLTVPTIALFGLNKFAVRLPNAIMGVLAVYLVFLLASKLFKNKNIGLITALLVTISPWHIMMSRGAFEANLVTLFIPLGIYLFLQEKYYLSAISFGLTMFTYHTGKFLAPLIFVLLIFFYHKNIKKLVKPIMIFIFFVVLTIFTIFRGAGGRIVERSITQGALEDGAKVKIELINKGMNPIMARLLHNKYQVVASRFVYNYRQYFSPKFLILEGPAETTYGMMKGLGVLTYLEIIGFLTGLYFLIKPKNIDPKIKYLTLLWLLMAPVPASLATGVGYAANRAVSMIPVIQVISGFGLFNLIDKRNYLKYIAVIIGFVGLVVFIRKYLIESPITSAQGMLSQNLRIANDYISKSLENDTVVVPRTLSEPQIYIAFVSKMDPRFYQIESKNWRFEDLGVNWVDQIPEYRLGKYIFKNEEQ